MLSRLARGALTALLMAGCASAPPSVRDETPAIVAATWVADDGTVVVVNLVVASGTTSAQIRGLAEREREHHPGARVIVRIFGATSGPERYVIGHVPAGTGPPVQPSPTSTLVGVYDFPR